MAFPSGELTEQVQEVRTTRVARKGSNMMVWDMVMAWLPFNTICLLWMLSQTVLILSEIDKSSSYLLELKGRIQCLAKHLLEFCTNAHRGIYTQHSPTFN